MDQTIEVNILEILYLDLEPLLGDLSQSEKLSEIKLPLKGTGS